MDDALLFNPMISKKDTSDSSGEIPEEARKSLQEGLEKRKRWIEESGRRGN